MEIYNNRKITAGFGMEESDLKTNRTAAKCSKDIFQLMPWAHRWRLRTERVNKYHRWTNLVVKSSLLSHR